jgi:hypothetical protein
MLSQVEFAKILAAISGGVIKKTTGVMFKRELKK